MTAEELFLFHGEPDRRYELVDGNLIELPLNGAQHGAVAAEVAGTLYRHLSSERSGHLLGPAGFIIRRSPDTVRAPDLAFVARQRLSDGWLPEGYLAVAPDFVAEVVSPNDTAREVQQRIDDWLQAGASVVMVVYPESKTVFLWRGLNVVERRSGDEEVNLEPAIPGFHCSAAELFPE
ncbi:MAG TPA: Uma2 family endonuclease [Chloroflexota bacterium]|nr:Uma2 family endonuclease [Chloroflexota bacterium]